jgi:hypothetical protein
MEHVIGYSIRRGKIRAYKRTKNSVGKFFSKFSASEVWEIIL